MTSLNGLSRVKSKGFQGRGVLLTLAAVAVGSASAQPLRTFAVPAAARGTIRDVKLTGRPVGELWTKQFSECDANDIFRGNPVTNKCSTDPSHNSLVLILHDEVVFFDGKMALDRDGSAFSLHRKGSDLPATSLRYPSPQKPSIDSDRVPYIVIPKGFLKGEQTLEMGDVAVVVNRDKRAYAIVGDTGPPYKIGEGSVRLHELLGDEVCLTRAANGDCQEARNQSIERDVLYFVFLGSSAQILPGLTPDNINTRIEAVGSRLWSQLMGLSESQ